MSNPSYYVGIAEPGNVIASSTSTSLSFTGLTANTAYSMYVIGIYANNTVTSIGTYSFTTTSNVTVLQTSTFAYTGANQTVTVPAGTTYVTAQLWGAGGGSGAIGNTYAAGSTCANGGGGGYTTANLTVTSGTVLTVVVGQAGYVSGIGGQSLNTYGGGGGCANLNGDNAWRNSSGGGRSAIQISSADIITAGGGGGGGHITGTVNGYTCAGGAGGGLIGGSGGPNDPDTSFDGKGGTQSAGGAAGTGQSTATAGSQYQGGTGSQYAAGGGGGWYGGGGAVFVNINTQSFGGGGGGSSYISGTYLQAGTSATLTQASGSTVAANASLPAGVQGTIGGGGAGSTTGNPGQNGYVVLTFYSTSTSVPFYLNNSTSLMTYYTFDTADVNGVYLKNSATNSYDASMINSASIISTSTNYKVGTSALNLNGTSQYASIAPNAFYLGSSGISVSYWLRSNSSAFTSRSFAFSNGYLNNTVMMETAWNTTTPGSILIDIGNSGGTEFVGATNYVSNNNTWMHVVWTINTNGTNLFYVNGVLNNTYTGIAYPTSIQRNLLFIGQGEQLASTPYFIGQIDDFRVYNCLLSANDAAQLYNYTGSTSSNYYPLSPSWTPAYSNLVAYFMLDETSGSTLVKEQISSYNGTVVGGVTFGSAGIVGNSGTFNGSTGYVSVPYQVLNNLTTGTIMAWVYPTAITGAAICSKQRDGSDTMAVFSIGSAGLGSGLVAGTPGKLYWHGRNAQSPSFVSSTSNLTANKWSHVAVTFGTSYVNFYINGVFDSRSAATNATILNEATTALTQIGAWFNNGGMAIPFPGQIDDFSVWNTVLNPSQVFQIYKTQLYGPDTFYLNTSPYLTHYYSFETADLVGTSVLNKATNKYDAALINSAAFITTAGSYKVGSSALNLISTGSPSTSPYFSITNGITLGTTGLSFAIWFKSNSSGAWARIFEFGNGAPNNTIDVTVNFMSSTNQLAYEIQNGSGGLIEINSGLVVNDNTWRHLVWTVSTANTWLLYINGALYKTDTNMYYPNQVLRGNAWLGKSEWNDQPFNGQMDDFRVYNCVLSANDVAKLYTYTGTNPTTNYYPLSPTWTPYYGNLLAYYMLDDAVSSTTVKDQINSYTATVVGAVTFGNSGKLSTCAFFNNLSSSTGYLTLPSIPVTSSNMSFSFWANIPSITGNAETFIELGNSSSDHIRIFLSSTNYLVGTVNSSDSNLFLINPYFNQWIHIVITISAGTNWTVYLNGTSMATVTKTAFTLNTKTLNNIGRSPSYSGNPYYYGYLDDFAIWNTALSAAAVNGIYNTQRLAIYNDKLYTVPRLEMNFELMFGSSTLPTVDNFGSTLTSTGSPTIVNHPNRAFVLSCAASQYITTTINTGTGSFSRCFWYNPQALNNNNTLSSLNCAMWYNNTNFVHVRFNFASGTALTLIDTVARGTSTWTHYVITYDATLLTGTLYANGSLISSGSVTFSETGPLVIGGYSNGGNSTTSYYDNIHLYNRALTAAEITAMYNYELDNPTDSIALLNDVVSTDGLTKRYLFNSGDVVGGRLYNYATGTYDATVYNSPTFSTSISKVGGSSLSFNGSNQYVNIDAFTLPSTNITVTGWFYVLPGATGWARFFDFGNGAGSNNFLYAPGNGLSVYGSTQVTQPGLVTGYNNSAWHFIAWTLTNNGTGNGTWNVYMDNAVVYTNTNAAFPTVISRSNNFLMFSNWAGDGYTTGYLNDFRIYSRILSAAEISALYNFTGFSGPIPSAPTSVSAAVASSTSVTVSFTPPSGTVTSYTVTSSPGSIVATGTSSPITVTGLTASTAYTFTVTATNAAGTSPASAASASVTTSATYPTPTLQFDATVNVTTSGTAVTSWRDITGTYNATQATVSQQPTLTANYMNSKNGVVFSGPSAGQLLTVSGMPFTTTNTMVIFAVMNISSNPQMQNFCSTGGSGWATGYTHNIFVSNQFQLSLNPYGDFRPTGSVPFNTPFILMYYYSFNSGTTGLEFLRLNGTSSNKTTPATQASNIQLNQLDIGGWSGGGRTINGGICDLLFYNYAMTQTQVQSVESYLSTKWNIAISQGAL